MSKKNKKERDWKWNDIEYKLITKKDEDGKINQLMQKPNFKQMDNPNIHVSGCHIFKDKPEENHFDHYKNGVKWEDRTRDNMYLWSFSGNNHIRFDLFQKLDKLRKKNFEGRKTV